MKEKLDMFNKRLKEIRLAKKYTMKSAADALKMPFSTYSKYESGERTPDLYTLARLAKFFNCSSDYLIGLIDYPDAYPIEKETLPVEPLDSEAQSEMPDPSKLSAEEVQAIRRLLAERPDLK